MCLFKTMIRRTDAEQDLRDVLLALREYKVTPEQARWLQNFQNHKLKERYGDELMQRISQNGLYVFPTHEEEWSHNKKKAS